MNTMPHDTHAARSRPDARPDARQDLRHARPDEGQRRTFDQLMSEAEDPQTAAADTSFPSAIAPWWPAPQSPFADADLCAEKLGTEEPAAIQAAVPAPVHSAPEAAATSAPFVMPSSGPQASLFQHLALPLAPAEDIGRFEVLGGSAVSGVDVVQQASGGLSVVIGTSVQNAQLLDRHLAMLQRRLPDKVSAHVRVQERDQGHHGR